MQKFTIWSTKFESLLSKPTIFFIFCFLFAFAKTYQLAVSPYTSPFDEHSHLSYVQYAFNWIIPAEGYPMNSWAKAAFSCHPHAIYGIMTPVPCGTIAEGKNYPTGGTNTSQTWPPLYFFIVAILMRIPLLWVSDPLIAARLVTATLWSLGAAWLGYQVWRQTANKIIGISVVALLVALPTFYYFSSNVSPHSLNPLILALGLFVATKLRNIFTSFSSSGKVQTAKSSLTAILVSPWLYLFMILGLFLSMAVPQSLTVLGLLTIYLCASCFFDSSIGSKIKLLSSFIFLVAGAISTAFFVVFFRFWQWQVYARAIPVSSEVNPAGANSDPADPIYTSPIIRIINRFWSFWPEGIRPGFPVGEDVDAVIGLWLVILSGLAVTAVVIWKKSNWLGPLMLSLFIAAPIFSIAYDYFFTTDVPIRYGMIFPLVGVLAISNIEISRVPRMLLTTLIVATYLSAFLLDPTYVQAINCELNNGSHLVVCN